MKLILIAIVMMTIPSSVPAVENLARRTRMDQKRRDLERRLAADPTDKDARCKLDNLKLRVGENPSWDYFLEEQKRLDDLQREHLFEAINQEFAAFFKKHPNSGIKEFSWGTFNRIDFSYHDYIPTHWEMEGLVISIDDDIWDEHCQITDWGNEFSAITLVNHLKGVCDCKKVDPPVCWIGDFGWIESEVKRVALASALEEAIVLYNKLSHTRRNLVHAEADSFRYSPDGAVAEKHLFTNSPLKTS